MTGKSLFIIVVVVGALLAGLYWAVQGNEGQDEEGTRNPVLAFLHEQFSSASALIRGGAQRDYLLTFFVIVGAVFLAWASLREYQTSTGAYLAAPDYVAETVPALKGLHDHGLQGYLDNLPGYPGIMIVQLIPAVIANFLGLSEGGTFRFLSAIDIAVLALAIRAALPLIRASGASRGSARLAVLLAVASPAAYWALRIGHPEEILTTGLLLGALVAAARERPILAGVLLGLSIGKAWPAAAALPVIAMLFPDLRRVIKACVATVVALAVIYLPPLIFASHAVKVLSTLGQSGIFNVGQVFWWFGDPLPLSTVATQAVPQPRGLGPAWSGSISHPLVLGVGVAIGLVWCWSLYSRMAGGKSMAALRAALRTDGATRSREQSARLAGGALMIMAGILYARCFLDTWNVPYYLLPGLAIGAIGEVMLGRRPILTTIATAMWWKWTQPGDPTVRTSPDIYSALFLAWSIPFCLAFLKIGWDAIRDVGAAEAAPEPDAGAEPATAGTLATAS